MATWIDDYYADVDAMRLEPYVERHSDDAAVVFGNNPPAVGKQAISAAIGGFWAMSGGLRALRLPARPRRRRQGHLPARPHRPGPALRPDRRGAGRDGDRVSGRHDSRVAVVTGGGGLVRA